MICPENKYLPRYSKESNELEMLYSMPDDKRREYMILSNLRLSIYRAARFSKEEDFESIAIIGLIKAVDSFDFNRNVTFATYASRCIDNEILLDIRKNKRNLKAVPYETIITDKDGNEITLLEFLGEDDNCSVELEKEELKEEIRGALAQLPEKEKRIICLLYGIDGEKYTQCQVANMLGLSQSYVCRLEKRAFERLRRKLRDYS